MFSALSDITREVRLGDERSLAPRFVRQPATPACLKCGWPIEASKHFGHVWYFDPGGEVLHKCRPTLNQVMAAVRRKLRRDE